MDDTIRLTAQRLAALRARAETLRELQRDQPPLPADAGRETLAAVREAVRPLLEAVADTYRGLCPDGYPLVEDNGITGAGGSVGVRFSPWHAFFVSLDNVRKPRPKAEEAPAVPGVATAPGVRLKRLPGSPLPPPDPNVRVELATLALRWDPERGWVEVRRALPVRWDRSMVEEHLAGYLIGLNYDVGPRMAGGDEL